MVIKKENKGKTTKEIEKMTSHIPSTIFLGAALLAMSVSIGMKTMCKNKTALFTGLWVAPFVLFSVYNKLVKTENEK